MDRSELSLEQAFEDWSFGSSHVLAVVAGAVLLRLGWTLFNLLSPPSIIGLAAILYVYVAALGLLTAAATGVDFDEHGRLIGYGILSILLVVSAVAYVGLASSTPSSDAAVFAQYGADLVLDGENPYRVGMAGAWNATGTTPLSVTPMTDGGHVTSYSYPSGLLVATVPVRALGLNVTRLTLVAGVLVLSFLVLESPVEWMLAPVAALLANNWLHVSFLGTVDVVWVLPVLLAMRAWYRSEWLLAGGLLGVAAAIKPQPWLILPFLAVELYRSHDVATIVRVAGAGAAAFSITNLPFLLWNPSAWLQGVLTPFTGHGASLVHSGVGLTMLTTSGAFVLPKLWYVQLFGGLYLLALAGVLQYGDRARWVSWTLPLALLLVNYRSLQTYFLVIVPLAYYAVLLETERVDDRVGLPWRNSDA